MFAFLIFSWVSAAVKLIMGVFLVVHGKRELGPKGQRSKWGIATLSSGIILLVLTLVPMVMVFHAYNGLLSSDAVASINQDVVKHHLKTARQTHDVQEVQRAINVLNRAIAEKPASVYLEEDKKLLSQAKALKKQMVPGIGN